MRAFASAEIGAGKRLDILEIPERPTEEDDAHIIDGIAQVSNKVIERALGDLLDGVNDFDLYRIFGAFRDLAGALVTATPVFFAGHHFGRQERQVCSLWEGWTAFELPRRADRLAVFSDSLDQVDGVSTWCTRFVDRAREAQQEVLIPHCGPPLSGSPQDAPLHQLPAITSFAFPLYDQLKFYVPSLIDTLVWAWRERITHVELATPGPMGLVGLLVAKVLQLPVTASYHTEVPALVNVLGGIRCSSGWGGATSAGFTTRSIGSSPSPPVRATRCARWASGGTRSISSLRRSTRASSRPAIARTASSIR